MLLFFVLGMLSSAQFELFWSYHLPDTYAPVIGAVAMNINLLSSCKQLGDNNCKEDTGSTLALSLVAAIITIVTNHSKSCIGIQNILVTI